MAPKAASKKEAKAAKADKPKVKRAPSPYIIFCSEKRPGIKISHPDATFGETGKMLGQMWAAIDDKTKAVSSCFILDKSYPGRSQLTLPTPTLQYNRYISEIRG
jgi:hypothetical protein